MVRETTDPTTTIDLTGYTLAPRRVELIDRPLNMIIDEQITPQGIRLHVHIPGLKLKKKQQQQLEHALMIWKYGVKEEGAR